MYACCMKLFKRSLVCVPFHEKKRGGVSLLHTFMKKGIECMLICYVLKTLRSRICVSVFTESVNLCIFHSMAHFGNVC